MEFTEYQERSKRSMNSDANTNPAIDANTTLRLCNWAMGLAGEAGEINDALKKTLFHGHDLDKESLAKEVGDALWYAAALCTELDLSLNDVAYENIRKLMTRYPDKFSHDRSINRSE